MPATITHAYFTLDVYEELPENIKSLVKNNLDKFKMFGQSTDCLYFYNLFSLKSGRRIREFAHAFHDDKTQAFFMNLISYIKRNNLENNEEVITYLFGHICHYVLDSILHPYIIYKTGWFNPKNPRTFKYNNIHTFMENFLDVDMVKRRQKINPYRFRFDKWCFDTSKFSKELNNTIDYAYEKTFNIPSMHKIYYKSLKQMKNACRVFRYDPLAIKKGIYMLLDTFTPKNMFRFEAISYHVSLENKHNYLNNNHTKWHYPTDYNLVSEESFIELYIKSVKIATNMITIVYNNLIEKYNIPLEEVFTNNSYLTGKNCNLEEEFLYFEF